MKFILFFTISAFAALFYLAPLRGTQESVVEPIMFENSGKGFAVVELFTSQGCSSCPPADRHLQEIVSQGDSNVYVLSFHVDYWNYLGWKDPYSSADYSQRQRTYAQKLRSRQVYTPQMIINGRDAFVGSDRSQASMALKEVLATPTEQKLQVRWYPGQQLLHYEVDGLDRSAHLRIALVSKITENSVPRGENRGRTLKHVQVVRQYKSLELSKSGFGDVDFAIPEGLDPEQLEIIVYLQDQASWRVLAGGKIGEV